VQCKYCVCSSFSRQLSSLPFVASTLDKLVSSSTTVNGRKSISHDEKDNNIQLQLATFEHRFETYLNKCFVQFQQHIDNRFDRLEERLANVEKSIRQ
jgi:hypothetical protein